MGENQMGFSNSEHPPQSSRASKPLVTLFIRIGRRRGGTCRVLAKVWLAKGAGGLQGHGDTCTARRRICGDTFPVFISETYARFYGVDATTSGYGFTDAGHVDL